MHTLDVYAEPGINLLTAKTLSDPDLPDSDDVTDAHNFLFAFLKNGAQCYVANANTRMMALQVGGHLLPITLNQKEYDNTYVCSPYTHYVTYAIEELKHLNQPFLEAILKYLLQFVGVIFKASQINNAVIVNNWLVSTNLYPVLSNAELHQITEFFKARFPKQAILFRSINSYQNACLESTFRELGYRLIGSRQVYFLNPDEIQSKAKWLLKRDFNLIQKADYQIVQHDEIQESDLDRIVELYNMLYLQKYSYQNPQFTKAFIQLELIR